MTRPFGWDTLSVRVFEFISEGEWERASVPALFIVAISLTAIVFMNQDESQTA
jgi:iron(III) transport system permease protein